MNTWRRLYRSPVFCLCASVFFLYSVLWSLDALVSLDSRFCLLNSGNLLGSVSSFFLSAMAPGNFLKVVSWGNFRIHLLCFLFLRDHCSLLPYTDYLKNCCFIYFCLFFFFGGCFRWYGTSGPCYFILTKRASLVIAFSSLRFNPFSLFLFQIYLFF